VEEDEWGGGGVGGPLSFWDPKILARQGWRTAGTVSSPSRWGSPAMRSYPANSQYVSVGVCS